MRGHLDVKMYGEGRKTNEMLLMFIIELDNKHQIILMRIGPCIILIFE